MQILAENNIFNVWQLLPIHFPEVRAWVRRRFGALSATAGWWCRGSLSIGRGRSFLESATGSREYRVSPAGLVRLFQFQPKSAFQWVRSAVRCVVSWSRMRTRNLLPSNQLADLKRTRRTAFWITIAHLNTDRSLTKHTTTNLDDLIKIREAFIDPEGG